MRLRTYTVKEWADRHAVMVRGLVWRDEKPYALVEIPPRYCLPSTESSWWLDPPPFDAGNEGER